MKYIAIAFAFSVASIVSGVPGVIGVSIALALAGKSLD